MCRGIAGLGARLIARLIAKEAGALVVGEGRTLSMRERVRWAPAASGARSRRAQGPMRCGPQGATDRLAHLLAGPAASVAGASAEAGAAWLTHVLCQLGALLTELGGAPYKPLLLISSGLLTAVATSAAAAPAAAAASQTGGRVRPYSIVLSRLVDRTDAAAARYKNMHMHACWQSGRAAMG